MSEWPFEDPENVVSLTVRPILEGHQPILLVCHDADDGTWQFLTGGEYHMEDAMMVALRTMYRHDLSIGEVADLPLGWSATRTAVGQPWRRSQDGGRRSRNSSHPAYTACRVATSPTREDHLYNGNRSG